MSWPCLFFLGSPGALIEGFASAQGRKTRRLLRRSFVFVLHDARCERA